MLSDIWDTFILPDIWDTFILSDIRDTFNLSDSQIPFWLLLVSRPHSNTSDICTLYSNLRLFHLFLKSRKITSGLDFNPTNLFHAQISRLVNPLQRDTFRPCTSRTHAKQSIRAAGTDTHRQAVCRQKGTHGVVRLLSPGERMLFIYQPSMHFSACSSLSW